MTLVARYLPGQRNPEFYVSKEEREKMVVILIGSAVFGMVGSFEDIQAWAADCQMILIS